VGRESHRNGGPRKMFIVRASPVGPSDASLEIISSKKKGDLTSGDGIGSGR